MTNTIVDIIRDDGIIFDTVVYSNTRELPTGFVQIARTCSNCKFYINLDVAIYLPNLCSQYNKVFINKREGFHLMKVHKEPSDSCNLWEEKDSK